MDKKRLKSIIKEIFEKSQLFEYISNDTSNELDEERIVNHLSKELVKKRQNFIGSHIFGEDLGDLGKMYVAYSYGEQFPTYLYTNGKWYHNYDDYVLEDGSTNVATEQHKEDMKPSKKTIGISTKQMQSLISNFRKSQELPEISHKSVEPGEKN